MKVEKKLLFCLLLVGLILRLVIAPLDYRGDVNNHIAWGQDAVKNGIGGFYTREYFPKKYGTANPNYPPFAILAFYTSELAYQGTKEAVFFLNKHVPIFPSNAVYLFDNPKLLPAFYKVPAIVADIGIAYIIYLFALALTSKRSRALFAASLIVFNPAFFYNSAVWGQIESIPLFFVLAGLYKLLLGDNLYKSLLFLTIALLVKQTAVVFLPVFLVGYLKKYPFNESVKSFFVSLIFFVAAFIPFSRLDVFMFINPFVIYWTHILTVSGLPYVSNHAFNFWALVTNLEKIPDTSIFLYGLSYRVWGMSLTAVAAVLVFYKLTRWGWHSKRLVAACFLISFASFLFLTRMHERHLQPALPFLLILVFYNWRRLPTFIFLSLFSFFNLFDGWWLPQMPNIENMLSINNMTGVLTMLAIGVFFVELIEYLLVKDTSG